MTFNAEDYTWINDTPKNCPPGSAEPAEGRYYRAVKDTPPDDSDFMRWIDEPHNLTQPKICPACGVSIYSSADGVRRMINRFPGRWSKFPNHGIAQGDLEQEIGVISQSGKDLEHYNLWVQKDVELRRHFNHTIEI